MCRYQYGKGKCAHPNNLSLDCVGEGKCVHLNDDEALEKVDSSLSRDDVSLSSAHRCSNTQCGIYCEKYNRFYCAGEENCEEKEEYF